MAGTRRLKQLEEENRRLKALVADLTHDKTNLRDDIGEKWRHPIAAGTSWHGGGTAYTRRKT